VHSLPRSLLHSILPKVLKLLVFLHPTENQTTAMISVCFIILAVIYGLVTNRFGIKTLPAVAAWLGKVGKKKQDVLYSNGIYALRNIDSACFYYRWKAFRYDLACSKRNVLGKLGSVAFCYSNGCSCDCTCS